MGNRVMKMVHNNYRLNLPPESQEYYIRDASGNIMSTYKRANASAGTSYNMKVTANDQPMYGSDRLGSHISGYLKNNTNTSTIYNSSIYGYYILLPTISLPTANSLKSDRLVSYRMMDYKRYEIKDHLGNVRTTFGDYRLSTVSGTGTGPYTKTNFEADQKSMYNLYAFGMPRYGNDRYYEANDIPLSMTSAYSYRFGFNGQQKENDISGTGNHNTAQFWEYDTRLGIRWNRDPVVREWESPYSTFGRNPIIYVDPNGADFKDPKGNNRSSPETTEAVDDGQRLINHGDGNWKEANWNSNLEIYEYHNKTTKATNGNDDVNKTGGVGLKNNSGKGNLNNKLLDYILRFSPVDASSVYLSVVAKGSNPQNASLTIPITGSQYTWTSDDPEKINFKSLNYKNSYFSTRINNVHDFRVYPFQEAGGDWTPGVRNLYTIDDKNTGLIRIRTQTDILKNLNGSTEIGMRLVIETARVPDISHPGSIFMGEISTGIRYKFKIPEIINEK